MQRTDIVKFFEDLSYDTKGIGAWLGQGGAQESFDRLAAIEKEPLGKVQLNQLLTLSRALGVSDDFFRYYWLSAPEHTYDITKLGDYDPSYGNEKAIISLKHLKWGLTRIYIDGLLYFGNIKYGYKALRNKSMSELTEFFRSKRIPIELIKNRDSAMKFKKIAKDDRYLISEMACKNFGDKPMTASLLKDFLIKSYKTLCQNGPKTIKIRELINKHPSAGRINEDNQMFLFSADDILEETVSSELDIESKYETIAARYDKARMSAIANTEYYLSLAGDLDVYMATSMRTRQDFRNMADFCEKIFESEHLKDLNLRYFDPTISAADGHEDKGLIECLMVKCSKVLVYSAGEKESYGKDAEAAMALSLGKPVIFYCNRSQKEKFYKDIHPLSRLVDFASGVAVGAIVTDSETEVACLLRRIFENRMEYTIEQRKDKPGYFRLREKITGSVVRIQTNDELLSGSFWNHYLKK